MSVTNIWSNGTNVVDPIAFQKRLWPQVNFYDKQREVIYSVRDNDETYLVSANQMGKDFVAAFIVLWYFMSRFPCKIIITSAGEDHLPVLWAEIDRFIRSAKYPLTEGNGKLVLDSSLKMSRAGNQPDFAACYCWGLVASDEKKEKMSGHHATPSDIKRANDGVPRNLFLGDEASSLPQRYLDMRRGWAKRSLIFGNAEDCTNDFYFAFKGTPDRKIPGGDVERPNGKGHYRKVFQFRAVDSPNVKLGIAQKEAGIEPTDEMIVPGVMEYSVYQKHLKMLNEMRRSVTLEAEFYEGKGLKMFPKEWMDRAEKVHEYVELLKDAKKLVRKAMGMGVDSAEGGDNTAYAVVDKYGLIHLEYAKTPNTDEIYRRTLELMRRFGLSGDQVVFDTGGGGKQHADRLRAEGYPVRAVGFSDSIAVPPQHGTVQVEQRQEKVEEKSAFKDMRSKLFGTLHNMLDPGAAGIDSADLKTFAIPRDCWELRQELEPIPLTYKDGKMYLIPKHKPNKDYKGDTLVGLIGHSPDLADATVLAIYAMMEEGNSFEVTAF